MATINGSNLIKNIILDRSNIDLHRIKMACNYDNSLCIGCDIISFTYSPSNDTKDSGNCNLCYGLCLNCFAPENGYCQECISSPFILSIKAINGFCKCQSGYYYNFTLKVCSSCNENSNCQLCSPGEYLNDAECQTCSSNCLACDGYNDFCVICKVGFFLNESSHTCYYTCKPHCNVCIDKCYDCQENYSLIDGECLYTSCSDNCLQCNETRCLKCLEGYYLVKGDCFNKNGCKNAIITESEILYKIMCIECESGFELINGKCHRCPPTCEVCSKGACFVCTKGYLINQYGECQECSPNCLNCSEFNICSICEEGYFLFENGICYLCSAYITECIECHDYNECIKCNDGYYLYSDNSKCVQCTEDCESCLNGDSCDKCSEEMFWSEEDKMCTSFTLSKCLMAKSLEECVQCPDSMYLLNGLCFDCFSYCLRCINDDTCIECEEGYYSERNECLPCSENVRSCVKEIVVKCKDGWYKSSNTTCAPCALNCAICNSAITCLECIQKYFINPNTKQCDKCMDNCFTCLNNHSCEKWDGMYYINNKQELVTCKIDGCQYCYSQYICSQCNSSYDALLLYIPQCIVACKEECDICVSGGCYTIIYDLDNSDNIASYDPSRNYYSGGCKVVDESEQCIECEKGYYLESNECAYCQTEDCISCNENNECIECEVGYYLFSDFIIACISSIPFCTMFESVDICIECKDGYFTYNNYCNQCEQGCLKCINASYCLVCGKYNENSEFFFEDHHSCIRCPPGCTNCSDSITCYSCGTNYYLLNYKCSSCGQLCEICIDSMNCIECMKSTYLLNGRCFNCPSNCFMCNSAKCILCIRNHYLIPPSTCKPIYLSEGCDEITNKECTSCHEYFYLLNGVCYRCNIPFCLNCYYVDELEVVKCSTCKNGYYESEGDCESKYWLAKSCYSYQQLDANNCCEIYNEMCFQCAQGYYISNDLTCVPQCIPHCQFCDLPYRCIQCNDGYTYIDYLCKPNCTANCAICRSSSCKKCNDGYRLEDNTCYSCFQSLCLSKCKTEDYGCTICGALMYAKSEQNCQLCLIQKLDRNPTEFNFSLHTGKFISLKYGNIIGTGYSGSVKKGYKNSICSIAYPKEGSIPLGKYRISDIICGFNNQSLPRVLKLEALLQFAYGEQGDSYYSDLYIYPDNEDDANIHTAAKGEYGIAANNDIRSKLTTGDIINVVANIDYQYITRCDIYPPPSPGVVVILATNISNEFIVKFADWGGMPNMTNLMKYEVCVEYDYSCKTICESSNSLKDNALYCNEGNENKLGYFEFGGYYTFKFRVRYNGLHYGIYSEVSKIIQIHDVQFTMDAISFLLNSITPQSLDEFYQSTPVALAAFFSIKELREGIQTPIQNTDQDINDSYCMNGGTLYNSISYHICQCNSEYYGVRCSIPKLTYNAIISYSSNIIDFLSKSKIDWHRTHINKLLDAYFLVTAIPEIISTHIRISLIKILLNSINERWSDQQIQHLLKSLNGVLMSVLYSSETQNQTTARRALIEETNIIDQLVDIQNIYEIILNCKSMYRNLMPNNETIGIPKIKGYILKYQKQNIQLNEIALKVPKKFKYYFVMELPYLLFKDDHSIEGYTVGSNAVAYHDAYTPLLETNYKNLNVSINFSASHVIDNLGLIKATKNVIAKCVCHDNKRVQTDSLCTKVLLVNDVFSTSCKLNATLCYIVYKLQLKSNILAISIAVPLGIVVLAIVTMVILLKARARRLTLNPPTCDY